MRGNLLLSIVKQLNVKHTNTFTYRYFNEHPHKYNLFGLSSMLSDYGIGNVGMRILDKSDIHSMEMPFIAHTGNDFVIVEKVSGNEIQFTEGNKKIKIPLEEFYKIWTGYSLLVEVDKSSEEPNYKLHSQTELFRNLRKVVFFSILSFLFVSAFIATKSYLHPSIISLLIVSSAGLYIGYLLVLKQLHVKSDYADRLCSLFKYNDCNNILESDASKLFGVLSWSEVGLGYFLSNVVIISFLPSFVSYLFVINLFCLPYSFWSIWYQKFKAKQWCPLCLLVMLFLWGVFVIGVLFGSIDLSSVNFRSLLVTGSVYAVVILAVNMLVAVISRGENIENIRYEINSLKADEDVFKALLSKQSRYEVSKDTSRILLGNHDANLWITVFSNPHCNPCSRMHKRINKLIEQNNHLCVQYIFSSFNKELECSNKYLIGVYLQKNGEAKEIYDRWFGDGNFNKEGFFTLHPVEANTEEVIGEFNSHERWKEQSGLRATPTILVNGYKLPDNYKIEDLRYLSNI